jgi:hypothetical protein
MSEIYKKTNISPVDKKDPYSINVNEIEPVYEERSEKEKSFLYKNKPIDSLKLLYASIMYSLLEKTSLEKGVDLSHLNPGEQELYTLISTLSYHLLTLASADQSKNIEFIKSLSSTWTFLTLSVKRRQSQKHSHEYLNHLNELIHSIEIYGDKEGKTLGYYLNTKEMQDWFPLPYLKMLYSLHQEYIRNPAASYLNLWKEKIELLLLMILYPH